MVCDGGIKSDNVNDEKMYTIIHFLF